MKNTTYTRLENQQPTFGLLETFSAVLSSRKIVQLSKLCSGFEGETLENAGGKSNVMFSLECYGSMKEIDAGIGSLNLGKKSSLDSDVAVITSNTVPVTGPLEAVTVRAETTVDQVHIATVNNCYAIKDVNTDAVSPESASTSS